MDLDLDTVDLGGGLRRDDAVGGEIASGPRVACAAGCGGVWKGASRPRDSGGHESWRLQRGLLARRALRQGRRRRDQDRLAMRRSESRRRRRHESRSGPASMRSAVCPSRSHGRSPRRTAAARKARHSRPTPGGAEPSAPERRPARRQSRQARHSPTTTTSRRSSAATTACPRSTSRTSISIPASSG